MKQVKKNSLSFLLAIFSLAFFASTAVADTKADVKTLKKKVAFIEKQLKKPTARLDESPPSETPIQLQDVIAGHWSASATTVLNYHDFGIQTTTFDAEFIASSSDAGAWSSSDWPLFQPYRAGTEIFRGSWLGNYKILGNSIFALEMHTLGSSAVSAAKCDAQSIEQNRIQLTCSTTDVLVLTRAAE